MYRIEALLSARMFASPQIAGERLYFISNLDGHLSLYAQDLADGSPPTRLLPERIALQNPHLLGGLSFFVYPDLDRILVLIDQDGDENYQPMLIPLAGGEPQPAFGGDLADQRVHLAQANRLAHTAYFSTELRDQPLARAYQANLQTGQLSRMGESQWGALVAGVAPDQRRAVVIDEYTAGDACLYLWESGPGPWKLIFGRPLEARQPGEVVPFNAIHHVEFAPSGKGLLFVTALHQDQYAPGYLRLDPSLAPGVGPGDVQPVEVTGLAHRGSGELEALEHLWEQHYLLTYNIDGVSWVYEALFDEAALRLDVHRVLVGLGGLANGMLQSIFFDRVENRYALSFSSAITPTQIFTLEGPDRQYVHRRTNEIIEGIPETLLAPGEDASYTSFDGTLISARLYRPAPGLGFEGRRPLVLYVHGGPQGQERPDFGWFSMPLIQFLTLNGFAVFVPNVRGSTGYGLRYMKQVDHDWGGQDRLDHVHALTQVLPQDERLDLGRVGVVGRSYGGYMTLTLAARHPELFRAAVDMFGPYDLLSFMQRIPESWKPYFVVAVGDPHKDRAFLLERSPRSHIDALACPLLVIQGQNDPRVVEAESRDLVNYLQQQGKQVEYLVFENEGHDVLKFENRVRAYTAITRFFEANL